MKTPSERAEDFLKISSQFKLGHLSTESFHRLTQRLSQTAHENPEHALKLIEQVDSLALSEVHQKKELIWEMAKDIRETLKAGNKVFMCGCGATGRLSLVCETLYHQINGFSEQVIAFMAGGDFALIKSVESFEDKVEYGERQLMELGFSDGDLLLSPTEGGETPFVIGATNLAAKNSFRKPYFLYCNPDQQLRSIIRSAEVIDNPNIKKINLAVGAMAVSGSTRMQASTVLMFAIGISLLYQFESRVEFDNEFERIISELTSLDYARLAPLTKSEAEINKSNKYLNYISSKEIAISILTDTTERSPTFSLPPFENHQQTIQTPSLSYLFVAGTTKSQEAWLKLLGRSPRTLEWPEFQGRIGLDQLLGFDISLNGEKNRSEKLGAEKFIVKWENDVIKFQCQNIEATFRLHNHPLSIHLALKVLLNAHSTVLMGLLDRYEGNVMTWVRASNNKLIDRAARYCLQLLKLKGKEVTYEQVIKAIFEEVDALKPDEPIVLKVVNKF